MKVCIIGNSHVGALKRAWDRISKDHPGLELVFFAHRGTGMSALKSRDGQLLTDDEALASAMRFTSGGLDRIIPQDYDVFLIYGLRASPNFRNGNQYISSQAENQAAEDLTRNRLSFRILTMLRGLTDKRIFLGHDPLKAATVTRPKASPRHYQAGIEFLNERIYGPLGAEMLVQPVSTIVNGRNTHASFSLGSLRLAIGESSEGVSHPNGEELHMNDGFGEVWLVNFFTRLEESASTRSRGSRPKPREHAPSPSSDPPGKDSAPSSWLRFFKRVRSR